MLSQNNNHIIYDCLYGKIRFLLSILLFLFFIISLILLFPSRTASHPGRLSSELDEYISVDGNIERTDFVINGIITYATDKHYATIIRTKDKNNVLEEYFDEEGNPTQQSSGHYALLYEYNEKRDEYKLTYLGYDGKPIINTSGYSAMIYSYNESGFLEHERYFDLQGEPVKTISGSYGRQYKYENGRNTVSIWLDKDEKPSRINSGYAILLRTFYEEGANKGKVENEFYLDENEDPISLSLNQFGLHRAYDNQGRNDVLTYLGIDGEPIVTNQGYTTVKRTFYPNGSVKTEMYYDQYDNPIALSHGQYGVEHIGNKKIYLDSNGKEMFDLSNFLYNNPLSVIVFGLLAVILSMLVGKKENIFLIFLYLLFIIYITLMFREGEKSRAELSLFWSYKQFLSSPPLRRGIMNNIWLFIPIGIILFHILDKPVILFVPIILSVTIEVIQFSTGFGLAEFDDVISNGLGALIGFGIGFIIKPMRICLKRTLYVYFC